MFLHAVTAHRLREEISRRQKRLKNRELPHPPSWKPEKSPTEKAKNSSALTKLSAEPVKMTKEVIEFRREVEKFTREVEKFTREVAVAESDLRATESHKFFFSTPQNVIVFRREFKSTFLVGRLQVCAAGSSIRNVVPCPGSEALT